MKVIQNCLASKSILLSFRSVVWLSCWIELRWLLKWNMGGSLLFKIVREWVLGVMQASKRHSHLQLLLTRRERGKGEHALTWGCYLAGLQQFICCCRPKAKSSSNCKQGWRMEGPDISLCISCGFCMELEKPRSSNRIQTWIIIKR